MTPVFIDFETQSGLSLRDYGGRVYSKHSSTRVMCLCAEYKGKYFAYVPPDYPFSLPRYADDGTEIRRDPQLIIDAVKDAKLICAHNASTFDRYVWERFIGVPAQWIDTIPMARQAGLPAALDDLGMWFLGRGKDKGKEILKKCYTLTWNGSAWVNKFTAPGSVAAIVRYCLRDVELLQTVYERLRDFPFHDPGVLELDYNINKRGVGFDETLASKIATISTRVVTDSVAEIHRIAPELKGKSLRSIPAMRKWLEDQGVRLKNLRKESVERFIDDPVKYITESVDDEYAPSELDVNAKALQVLKLRSASLRITGSKLERAMAVCEGGRLHDLEVYYGSHTGRFSSRLVQYLNLPRGVNNLRLDYLCNDLTYEKVIEEAERLSVSPDDVLSSLIRPCFIPSKGKLFGIADFNAIELRVIAWLAGETTWLDLFRSSHCLYKHTASIVNGIEYDDVTKEQRQVAKPIVLGGVYGLGEKGLSLYAKTFGIDLYSLGLDPRKLINQFRSSCPAIAGGYQGEYEGRQVRKGGLWRDLQNAFINCVLYDCPSTVGKCRIMRYDSGVMIRLPSGRPLMYRKATVELSPAPWDANQMINVPTYTGGRGKQWLTGGKLAENITQAVARDVMVNAAIKCEGEGYYPVILPHDEIVAEIDRDEDLSRVISIMEESPPWGQDLPLTAEGHVSPRYTKGKWE